MPEAGIWDLETVIQENQLADEPINETLRLDAKEGNRWQRWFTRHQ